MPDNEQARKQITEWLTGNDTFFLFGAGTSRVAGCPLINCLTNQLLADTHGDTTLHEIFANLRNKGKSKPTVDDLMNHLMHRREILESSRNNEKQNISEHDIERWLGKIKEIIVEQLGQIRGLDDDGQLQEHRRFFLNLSAARPQSHICDIFTLNYDIVLETALDLERIPYIYGFQGGERAWFDNRTFDTANNDIKFRIFKLHGSVSWIFDNEGGYVRRRHPFDKLESPQQIVIAPAPPKRLEYTIYEELMDQFRKRLRHPSANNLLIICGYSFNAEHINQALIDATSEPGNNLQIIAFVKSDKNARHQQLKRLSKLQEDTKYRFHVFIDNADTSEFIDNIVDEETTKGILALKPWKFEKLVNIINSVKIG